MSEDTTASQETTEDAPVVIEETLITEEVKEVEGSGPKPLFEDTEKDKEAAAEAEPAKEEVKEEAEDVESEDDKPSEEETKEFDSLDKPEDSLLSDADMERIVSDLKEQGLSKEVAQKQVELASSVLKHNAEAVAQKHSDLSDQWKEECKADKEIGGEKFSESVKFANTALKKFGTEKFLENLRDTRFGNNPEVVRIFARIGRAMSPDELIQPGAHPGGEKSLEDIFYGKSNT